jgi:hypothetical protein
MAIATDLYHHVVVASQLHQFHGNGVEWLALGRT